MVLYASVKLACGDLRTDRKSQASITNTMDPNWFIAFFTLGLLYVAWKQAGISSKQTELMDSGLKVTKEAADAAKLSADTAKRALELCEAAELQIVAMNMSPSHRIESGSQFNFSYQNFGRTVATDVVSKVDFREEKLGRAFTSRAIIAAGYTLHCVVALDSIIPPFNEDELARINSGDNRLNVTVRTSYKDVFGVTQTIEYYGTFKDGAFGYMCTKYRTQGTP